MKEYCLVPRAVAEKMSSQNDLSGRGFISPQSTPSNVQRGGEKEHKESVYIHKLLKMMIEKEKLAGEKGIKRKREINKRSKRKKSKPTLNVTENKMLKSKKKKSKLQILQRPSVHVRENPSLEHIIHGRFSIGHAKYALSLFKFFENKPNIEWDDFGELKRPISGMNLIGILKKLMIDNTRIDDEDFEHYKLFLNAANVPFTFIRNEAAKRQLVMNTAKTPKGRGWVGYLS